MLQLEEQPVNTRQLPFRDINRKLTPLGNMALAGEPQAQESPEVLVPKEEIEEWVLDW